MKKRYNKGASLAIALVAGSRFWAYAKISSPHHEAPAILALTDGGRYLPLFAGLWLLVALFALWDGFIKDTGWSEPIFLAMMVVWGAAYGVQWVVSGYVTPDWITFTLYVGVAIHTLCRYLERSRMGRLLQLHANRTTLIATGSIPIQMRVPVRTDETVKMDGDD